MGIELLNGVRCGQAHLVELVLGLAGLFRHGDGLESILHAARELRLTGAFERALRLAVLAEPLEREPVITPRTPVIGLALNHVL